MNPKKEFTIKIAVMTFAGLLPVWMAGFYSPENSGSDYDFSDGQAVFQEESKQQEMESADNDSSSLPSARSLLSPLFNISGLFRSFQMGANGYEPLPERYNLMAIGSEGKEEISIPSVWSSFLSLFYHTDLSRSEGAKMYTYLNEKEASWVSEIYQWIQYSPEEAAIQKGLSKESVCGSYDPSNEAHNPSEPSTWVIPEWGNINLQFYDGDGNMTDLHSNTKEILSMANVFTYFWDWQNTELFQAYAEHLWYLSHQYEVTVGNVYYCEGCCELPEAADETVSAEQTAESTSEKSLGPADEIGKSNTAELSGTESSGSKNSGILLSTPSNAIPEANAADNPTQTASGQDFNGQTVYLNEEGKYCPGHVDLSVSVKITGLEENQNLFILDSLGAQVSSNWQGWTDDMISSVKNLSNQDWAIQYGLTQPALTLGKPLSFNEISDYMNVLPDDISAERRAVISCALNSAGRIPYYYGGKARHPGYAGNGFNSVTSPDHNGRIFSGLDCSGWVNWVYRTALGQDFSAQGTYNLVHSGRSISRNELKPGDLLIRLGTDSHVVMFLGWNMDGSMIAIHESAGKVNNVTVESMSADWPYYRAFLD